MSKAVVDLFTKEMDHFRGRCLQLVESWNLPPTREQAVKGTLKQMTYDSQARVLVPLEYDPLSDALTGAQESLRELQRCRAMLEESKRLGRPSVDAAEFIKTRAMGVEQQIADLENPIRVFKTNTSGGKHCPRSTTLVTRWWVKRIVTPQGMTGTIISQNEEEKLLTVRLSNGYVPKLHYTFNAK